MTRRSFVVAGAAAAGLGGIALWSGAAQRAPVNVGLDALAKTKGLRFGSSVPKRSIDDPRMIALLKHECGVILANNEFKWQIMAAAGPALEFTYPDMFAKFAIDNGFLLRGQVLIWDRDKLLPPWIEAGGQRLAAPAAESLLTAHVTQMCRHFNDSVSSWDVVNEALAPGHGTIRDGFFMRSIGPDYIDLTFTTARATAPKAQLVYNDYPLPGMAAHQQGVLKLLDHLRARRVPIDALGIESHLSAPLSDADLAGWSDFLAQVGAMGYKILLTELDVWDGDASGDVRHRDANAAALVSAYLDATLAQPAVTQIITRGLTDRYEGISRVRAPRPGMTLRPLPFDADYARKPMYQAIADAIAKAPSR